MAGQRIDLMEIRALIQLKQKKLSNRKVAAALGVDRKTVDSYVQRFAAAGLGYDELSTLGEQDLMDLFSQESQVEKGRYEQLSTHFEYIRKELSKPGATLQHLHREYQGWYPDGYSYTQFGLHFRKWLGKMTPGGKLTHKAGEKLYIDFCGKKLTYVNGANGEPVPVEVFVAILPCSQYTFVKAVHSQKKEDVISCLRDCLAFMGGVPQAIVSDNLKAVVARSHRYSPVINRTLREFALHYNSVIDPARPYHPKDKALVEGAVKLVYQRIYYPLGKQTFFSLTELNAAIRELTVEYNDYLFSHGASTRRRDFIDIEKASLSPLPEYTYHMREHKRAKVQSSSHVYLSTDRNYYSVPHRYQGLHVHIQYTSETVEIFYCHERIASHKRIYRAGAYTTVARHMPKGHQNHNRWSPSFFQQRAEKVGSCTGEYIRRLLEQYAYPELGYKQSQGILFFLVRTFGEKRVENACKRALTHPRARYRIIERILRNGLDEWTEAFEPEMSIPLHGNIRGKDAYR